MEVHGVVLIFSPLDVAVVLEDRQIVSRCSDHVARFAVPTFYYALAVFPNFCCLTLPRCGGPLGGAAVGIASKCKAYEVFLGLGDIVAVANDGFAKCYALCWPEFVFA